MCDIHPGILAHSLQEFREKAERVRALGHTIHVDVMDGIFVNNTTWADPTLVAELLKDTPFEAHLMVADPERAIPIWIAAGAARVIYHKEATSNDTAILAANNPTRLTLAINPATPLDTLPPGITTVLLMGVAPGWSGQPIAPHTLERVRELRQRFPSLQIGVDGGVNLQNATELKEAGADFLIATSSLTELSDPGATLQQFLSKIS